MMPFTPFATLAEDIKKAETDNQKKEVVAALSCVSHNRLRTYYSQLCADTWGGDWTWQVFYDIEGLHQQKIENWKQQRKAELLRLLRDDAELIRRGAYAGSQNFVKYVKNELRALGVDEEQMQPTPLLNYTDSPLMTEIKKRVTIQQVLKHYSVKGIRSNGIKGKALCPFHPDNDPSFSFDNQKGLWLCFGCRRKGNLFSLINQLEEARVKV